MKINAINNFKINQFQTKSNPIKQNIKLQKDTFELSFGAKNKRPKHSDIFLEITKNNKDLRTPITNICMIDKEGNFNPEKENDFIIFEKLYQPDSMDNSQRLKIIALAMKKQEENNVIPIQYFLGGAEYLLSEGFSIKEIESIFNWKDFDINTIKAFGILKKISSEKVLMEDAKIFLSSYCKDENGLTDTNRIFDLVQIFKFFAIDDKDEADIIYTTLLDKNGQYDSKRFEFFINTSQKILDYAYHNDKNAKTAFEEDSYTMKNLIYVTIDSLIESNQDENGDFDISKAYESFDYWFEYVTNNQEELNNRLEIAYMDKDKTKFGTINESIKQNPKTKFFADNTIFKLSCIFCNAPKTLN